ncbi:uncharacterized protein [Primulina huaijiensis]|uniref:uncharacterized protein isoform X1 n=1 Tax=Primulina huaijiensis TaxID=1492673 RepID=UPI003CC792A5
MATPSHELAVKSLNNSSGRRRFVFKTFLQRIEQIDIDVYRSLDPLKAEPSVGSSFFLDCLVEYRELNTAEDFISFYEEMLPLVQTLPQIILHKELIITSLLSRLQLKGRLSLEPILRLIAALSRDLLEDFIPFLQRIANSIESLLQTGADRDPEIIEQIFRSWSCIMMHSQKYLADNADHVLRITAKLRYYPKEYVREFMAESVSFLLRKTPIQKLKTDISKVMAEIIEEPSETRKSGVGALLSHVMRITSSRLHSRAEKLLPLLVDYLFIQIGNSRDDGFSIAVEVLCLAFQRLYTELDPLESTIVWEFFVRKITDCATENPSHLSCLLTILISMAQSDNLGKISDYRSILQLVNLLLHKAVMPYHTTDTVELQSDVIDQVLNLMLCVLNALSKSKNMSALSGVALQWEPIFKLRSRSLLNFLNNLLHEPSIFHVFGTNILSSFNNLIEIFEEEAVYLMVIFCEKIGGESYNLFRRNSMENLSRIHVFFYETLKYWIGNINEAVKGNSISIPVQQSRLAVLWGVIGCYSYFADAQASLSILMDLIDSLDEVLMAEYNFTGIQEATWQTLIGAALKAYHKFACSRNIAHGEASLTRFLDLAKRYKLSPQILAVVADTFDSVLGFESREDGKSEFYLPECISGNGLDALNLFAQNLCHADKQIRLSTLRILCHFELFHDDLSAKEFPVKKRRGDDSVACHLKDPYIDVLNLLRSIENTPLSIATSRQVILLLSKIQLSLSARSVPEQYLPAVLSGIVGIFYNRFSYVWNPASECLAVLIGQYYRMLWDKYVMHLDHCQSVFLTSRDLCGQGDDDCNKDCGLVGHFKSKISILFDSTPPATVLSLLIQSLHKVPSAVESDSRLIINLFLKFLGYNIDELTRVEFYALDLKGKEWKSVLQEWLSLFRLLRNPKALYQSIFFKDVLQYRLLEENDADIQMKVLDCLLTWKDDFLLPYSQNLKNLINAKYLREELTRWSLSSKSIGGIDVQHRTYIVPIVIRILIPKVRSLKMLACQKSGVSYRRAVLGFLAQLDVAELPLFFWLLIKPLLSIHQGEYEMSKSFWSLSGSTRDEFYISNVMKHFTSDSISTLSWKKKFGFLHVVEEILEVFDVPHLNPFLDLLAHCVVQILASCTSTLGPAKSSGFVSVHDSCSFEADTAENNEVEGRIMARTAVKHLKDLRSLCLKIIYRFLSKYEDHDFESAFWDLFSTSVKPLIANFAQEGASSKNPSSLFYCFLAMSKSNKLVPLLHENGNLVPDIFSMLTLPSASETILSCVFKFIMNLLELDSGPDSEDNCVKRILLPHLDLLIQSLQRFFTNANITKRKLAQFLGKREFTIFSLISKYVKEPSVAETFLDILLPLLTKKHQDFDTCIDVLKIVQQVVKVLESGSSKKILHSITPLLISSGLVVRIAICDVLDAIAVKDSSVLTLARILHELNASSEMEIGGLDYDKVICAYDKITVDFFYTIQEEHALVILAHSIQDMSSEELILRQSAFRLLVNFIEFSGKILNGSLNSNEVWSVAGIQHLANNFILKHMGNAMGKEGAAQKVWIDLLREMVLKLPEVASLDSYRALCSDDAEQDFFNNIVHLQKHRRAKALSRFRNIFVSGKLSEVITNKVLIPLFFGILLNLRDGKDEHIRNACLDALASISSSMKWNQYYALLIRCFRYIQLKPDKKNPLLRLVSSILDHFHFSEMPWVHDSKVAICDTLDPYAVNMTSSSLLNCSGSTQLPVIQMSLHKNLLPKIQKFLTSDSDKVNVTISLVVLKLLKLLPVETMELQLPSIIHRIANFLKNRLESVRDEARSALAACLKELGLEYLQFIIQVLKGTLKRGYELHVLGYTLNFMLSKFLMHPICGKLDYCLEDLLSVIENDILGDVSEEKEVEKIASRMKETRKQKSYETLKLIAQSITFKTHALKLLSPFTIHLNKQLTQKVKSKLENILSNIAAGIQCNPSVDQTDFFVFTYGLIEDCIKDEGDEHESNKVDKNDDGIRAYHSERVVSIERRHSHLIAAFALGLLQNYMKNLKLDKEDEKLLSLLDPFVSLLGQCLSSKHENVTTTAVRCLSPLVRLPLPSLQSHADDIKNSLLVIVQGSINASSPLSESCIKLLTTLLRSTRITLSAGQLYMLTQFPLFVDLAKNPTIFALSLLKAIVHRKLVVPEIYDVVQIVAELMVQSQHEHIRKKCGQIFLHFLLDYNISEKRKQQHLDFLLGNLSYIHPNGREAVLEMLHAIIKKFPQERVDEQSETFFVRLVFSLASDKDSKVRSMTAAAIKCLIGRVSSLGSILDFSKSWYLGDKQNLWGAAAQALGLLLEVMGEGFKENIGCVLPVTRSILQSALSALAHGEHNMSDEPVAPFWKEAYYSLVLFDKILHQFHDLCLDGDLEDMWEIICQFLLHPHLWLRNISNRILSLYFTVIDARTKNHKMPMEMFFLMKPSRLFLVAASFCSQLMAPLADDAACTTIMQNLVFSICHLHSILGKNACMDASKFWSSLENSAQDQFHKAFTILDPLKGRRILFSFTSDVYVQRDQNQHPFISYLLQKLGKLSFQMEAAQMKTVFNCFKTISPELLGYYGKDSFIAYDDSASYAYQMLLPVYKVCEGCTGKVVSDDLKQLAHEVRECIRVIMGNHFIQVYNLVRKNLKGKRDKRKQDEKIMAVVNPERNAKRKLRIAAKHRNNKRRKIMSMKMGRWMH